MEKLTENTLDFEKIINEIPAIIYINSFNEPGNPKSLVNVWSNRYALDFIGYSQEEIKEMGFSFFTNTLHPNDIELILGNRDIKVAGQNLTQATKYTALQRLKPKGKNNYEWFYGNGILIESYDSGFPKTILCVVIEVAKQIHSENQLITLLREVNRLKNECRCNVLTPREKELLPHIAKGLTDKEIANRFFISLKTAKTHRNNIIKKLRLKNSANLAAFATECGLN